MAEIDNIVNILIDRQTATITRTGFGTPAIIAEFGDDEVVTDFGRYKYYASVDELVADGWVNGGASPVDEVYDKASLILGQNPSPSRVMVGRKDSSETWTQALTAINIENDDWYAFTTVHTDETFGLIFTPDNPAVGDKVTLTIDGTVFNIVSTGATYTILAGDIETAVQVTYAGASVTADELTNTITVDLNETFLDVLCTHTDSLDVDQGDVTVTYQTTEEIASWVSTVKKIYGIDSNVANIKAITTQDIFSRLKALNYSRIFMCYHPLNEYYASALMGALLPYDPGSQTWAFKTLTGITPYSLSSAERGNVISKNVNIYTTVKGVNITYEGTTADGDYIDIIRGLDWLEVNIQEDQFDLIITNRKLPYNDSGINAVEARLKLTLDRAFRQGVINDDYETSVPLEVNVSSIDKANRELNDIEFTATLQGAIHKIFIVGKVTA